MNLKIAILNQKGSSSLLTNQVTKAFQAIEEVFDHNFAFREIAIPENETLSQTAVSLCEEADIILLNTTENQEADSNKNNLSLLTRHLSLYASAHLFQTRFIQKSKSAVRPTTETDMLLFQELEGGIPKIDESWDEGSTRATDFYEYTEAQINRIAHNAYKAAKKRAKQLTLSHYNDDMLSAKLWRDVVTRVGESYPEVLLTLEHVHTTSKNLLQNATAYDVILSDALFGGMLANQSTSVFGFKETAPKILFGTDSVLMNVVPTESDYGTENPTIAILSAAILLQRIGLDEEADMVQDAVQKSLQEGIVTPDVKAGSSFGTEEVGDCIAEHILDWEERFIPNDENIGLGQSTII